MSRRHLVIGAAVALACGSAAAPASALDQLVSGTALSTLSLTAATPAVFTSLSPGSTASSAGGTLVATSTSPSWTLSVKDAATGSPGHLVAAGVGCTGSAAHLNNAATVNVTPVISTGTITSAGAKSITGSSQTVASATSALLAATVFNTDFSQVVDTNELLTAGCIYSLTATYTIQ